MLDLLSNRLILTWHIGETLLHKSHPQGVVLNGIRIRSRKVQNFGHCTNSTLPKPLKIDNVSSKIPNLENIFKLPFLVQILAFGGWEFAQIDLCKSANSQRAFSMRGPYCPSPPQGRAPPLPPFRRLLPDSETAPPLTSWPRASTPQSYQSSSFSRFLSDQFYLDSPFACQVLVRAPKSLLVRAPESFVLEIEHTCRF